MADKPGYRIPRYSQGIAVNDAVPLYLKLDLNPTSYKRDVEFEHNEIEYFFCVFY